MSSDVPLEQGDVSVARHAGKHGEESLRVHLPVWAQRRSGHAPGTRFGALGAALLLGPDHPEVAFALANLSADLRRQGDWEAARTSAERALAIQNDQLDPNSPEIATSTYQLGRALLGLGEATEALPHLERSVAIYDAQAGTQQLEATARHWLARAIVEADGNRTRARELAERALAQLEEGGDVWQEERSELATWIGAQRWP